MKSIEPRHNVVGTALFAASLFCLLVGALWLVQPTQKLLVRPYHIPLPGQLATAGYIGGREGFLEPEACPFVQFNNRSCVPVLAGTIFKDAYGNLQYFDGKEWVRPTQ
jgi:hypothetical protein